MTKKAAKKQGRIGKKIKGGGDFLGDHNIPLLRPHL